LTADLRAVVVFRFAADVRRRLAAFFGAAMSLFSLSERLAGNNAPKYARRLGCFLHAHRQFPSFT
jgi:hypothetical protein